MNRRGFIGTTVGALIVPAITTTPHERACDICGEVGHQANYGTGRWKRTDGWLGTPNDFVFRWCENAPVDWNMVELVS